MRCPAYLAAIRLLPCVNCGEHGKTQAAHRNFGKGRGIKTDDRLAMALCFDCHRDYDQGGLMALEQSRAFAETMYHRTKGALMARGEWRETWAI